MREWLKDALFYEIYPQSFKDSDGDGIGDIPGVIEKLDYVQSLGCNALWLNPCFDSPFVDAGYDVADYYKVAPRYGTNEDLKRLFDEAHRRGMHVLLDLVPGHTSVECEWFRKSARDAVRERNEYTDRYIWTGSVWEGFDGVGSIMGTIRGGTERNGACAANFFNAQPALNYGFAKPDPEKPWQQCVDDAGPQATREEFKKIMRFWLEQGCDGFRVDMAGSLVKSDPGQRATIALWQDFRAFLDAEYPDAALVSEWGEPDKALEAGFHMDFLLHFGPSHYLDLFREEHPYFARESGARGDCKAFFDLYLANLKKAEKKGGLICIPSGNHDMIRMARTLDAEEMKLAFAFLLSMPGVPFLYYGDEIGERYVEGLKSVEGGYERTGSRSPMAFDASANGGFSAAPAEKLYIAQDSSIAQINAETESADEKSLLNEVRRLARLRKEHPALGNMAGFTPVYIQDHACPLAYLRTAEASGAGSVQTQKGERILVILNPSGVQVRREFEIPAGAKVLHALGGAEGMESVGGVIPAASAVFLAV